MKALSTLALSLILIGSAFATDPNYSVVAKAKNLDEVIQSIKYPTATRESGTEGLVLVILQINEDGTVNTSNVISSPCSQLKAEVERATKDLIFEPAKDEKGMTVASTVRLPIQFTLTID